MLGGMGGYGWHCRSALRAAAWLPAVMLGLLASEPGALAADEARPDTAPAAPTAAPTVPALPLPQFGSGSLPPPAATPVPPIAKPPLLPGVTVAAPEPKFVAPTTRDRIGRIWAPVLIDGKGPFRLVLDTGASSSAITQRVADKLGLPIRPESIRLRGVTGTAVASSVRAKTLEVGDLLVEGATLPIVADAFGGADGVLGEEGLANKRIVIEFRRDRITVAKSHYQRAPPGFVVVPFRYSSRNGLRVKAHVGSIRVTALIDTGAQVTIGNLALRQALARRRKNQELQEDIIGVTQDIQQATAVQVPSITAGELLVRNAPVRFTDLYIFEHWGMTRKPALLIGMDLLGRLDTLIIDYDRHELQLKTR